jgi:hypothetical protein
MVNIRDWLINFLYNNFYYIFYEFVYIYDKNRVFSKYEKPKYLKKNRKKYQLIFTIEGKQLTECGRYNPEIVYIISNINQKINSVILDGDSKKIVPIIKRNLENLKKSNFYTIGLGSQEDFDFIWDFEKPRPRNIPKADLVVSQAMLEHLLMPFEHLRDLTSLLNKEGHLVIHTQLPGYSYHRYPIDSVRFYPDFFEASADRLKLKIIEKFQDNFHIYYHFQKLNYD